MPLKVEPVIVRLPSFHDGGSLRLRADRGDRTIHHLPNGQGLFPPASTSVLFGRAQTLTEQGKESAISLKHTRQETQWNQPDLGDRKEELR